jgi:hypothetical protein
MRKEIDFSAITGRPKGSLFSEIGNYFDRNSRNSFPLPSLKGQCTREIQESNAVPVGIREKVSGRARPPACPEPVRPRGARRRGSVPALGVDRAGLSRRSDNYFQYLSQVAGRLEVTSFDPTILVR